MRSDSGLHENLVREEKQEISSDRLFGFVFFVFLTIVALLPLRRGGEVRGWAAGLALGFLLLALLIPRALRPLNRVWFRIGLVLHKVVNPLISGLIFYVIITPMAVVMRLFNRDELRLHLDETNDSYWINRQILGPPKQRMHNQF